MHSIKEESQEFLSVLLSIPTELASDSTYLLFQLTWSDRASFAHPCAFQEGIVRVSQTSWSQLLLWWVFSQEVLGQWRRAENTLQDGIHETGVANVVEACGAVAIAPRHNLRDWLLWHRQVVKAAAIAAVEAFIGRLQGWHKFCARRLRRLLLFKPLPYACASIFLAVALVFPEQGRVISGLLQLVFVWLLELSGIAIVVAKGVLLKVLGPDLRASGGWVLVLFVLVLAPIDGCPAVLSPADNSFIFSADNLASGLQKIQ